MFKDEYLVRLVPEKNCELLCREYGRTMLSRGIGDMRLVAVLKYESLLPEELYGISLRNTDFEVPVLTEEKEKLLEKAIHKSSLLMPPRIFFTDEINGKDMYRCGVFMEEDASVRYGNLMASSDRARKGIRLTTTCWFGGAIAVFYPEVAKKIGDMLASDYFVTFPTVHEARIHSCRWCNAQEIHYALECWNRGICGMAVGERLSRMVYRYCRTRDELQPVEYYDWNSSPDYDILFW
ncbi:MAG: hypothetical protein IJ796_02410 [Lachnospiraceae bacterium]|nr:hypothetical protein [Lachnospiraceae bacterium]